MDDKAKFQLAGLKFLYEMELVNDPQLVNNLKLNAFSISSTVRDVEFLFSEFHKAVLVLVDLNWFGRTFLRKSVEIAVLDRMLQLLPKFKIRVISDRVIFDAAIARIQEALKGTASEKVSTNSSGDSGAKSG